MMIASRIHVRFASRFGWTVEREGEEGHVSAHPTQSNAERWGRVLAQRERGRLYVHDLAGEVIRSDSFVPLR
jgi:hypothetical protein